MEKGWNGLPYRPISQFYQKQFGSKVYKIPLAIADDCPNRRGLKGMKPCVFCDEWGSAARSEAFTMDLQNQIEEFRKTISKRFKARHFLGYFQAYTNTFLKLQTLKNHFELTLKNSDIVGLIVGTRPDCLSLGVLNLWKEFSEKTFLGVEFGVQSFFDDQLQFLERGHSALESFKALEKVAKECPSVNLGIHLIFGTPGESDESLIETARICNQLPIHNIKLHHLHVLKNTPLAETYEQGMFTPIEFNEYARRMDLFLEHLSPHIYIHRLSAYSSRWSDLIAPAWTKDKMKTQQGLIDFLRNQGHFQSRQFISLNDFDTASSRELLMQSLKAEPAERKRK